MPDPNEDAGGLVVALPPPEEDEHERALVRARLRASMFSRPADPTRVGRFVLVDRLGSGGMGVVYRAYDPQLKREVAVKLLHTETRDDGDTRGRERLLREAQTMARLSHPNLVPVFEVGEHNDAVFLAMELIEGETLADWLAGERSPREILAMFAGAGLGLAAAHEAGVIHRDFKPANVLVGKDGRPRVLDFGLARAHSDRTARAPGDEAPTQSQLTRTGALLGTPAYMSPEQFEGGTLDARSDQFSFCVALYEALYGERPFPGETVAALRQAVTSGEMSERRWDGRIGRSLRRGLEPDPDRRFATMRELLGEIGHDKGSRRRWILVGGSAAIALVAGGFAVARISPTGACEPAETRLAGVWDDATKARIEARITTEQAGAWTEVRDGVDEYAAEWSTLYADACRDLESDDDDVALLAQGRLRCARWRLQELDAAADIAAESDVDVKALFDFAELRGCRDDRRIRAMAPPPSDAAAREEVRRLETELARAWPLTVAGKVDDALALSRRVAEQAESIGYRPLEARALLQLGRTLQDANRPRDAEEPLSRALWAAEAGGDVETIADTAQSLAFTVGYRLADPERGLEYARRAEAALEQLGGDRKLEGELQIGLTGIAATRGDIEGALEHALAQARLSPPGNLTNLSAGYFYLGRFDEMMSMARRAFEDDPENTWALEKMAEGLLKMGYPRRAQPYLERALEIQRTHGQKVNLDDARGMADAFAQRYDAAAAHWKLSAEYMTHDHERVHFETAFSLAHHANALFLGGRHDEARLAFERTNAAFEQCCGANYRLTSLPLTGLGRLLLAEGKPERALGFLEQAFALVEPVPRDPVDDAETRFALACALAETGGDATRARALASEALRALEPLGPGYEPRRVAMAAWLDSAKPLEE